MPARNLFLAQSTKLNFFTGTIPAWVFVIATGLVEPGSSATSAPDAGRGQLFRDAGREEARATADRQSPGCKRHTASQARGRGVLIEFDQTTMANMTAALGTVCKRISKGTGSHEVRKGIADAMVASAKSGRRTRVDFQNVGMKALQDITRRPKSSWLV